MRPKAIIRNKPADKSVCPGGTVAVPVQNSFDILCDSNDSSNDAGDLPADATPVEGLHSSTEYSSPFSASTYEVGESSGTSAPAADSVPGYFQSPPDLPTNSLKHHLVWDFLLGQWTDPEAYPSSKTRRSDPYSGMMYNSVIAIEDCDLSDSGPPDLATPYRNFWVSLRSNFHVDTPPAPGVRPVHSPEPARVTVEDFELPTHSFGTPSPVTPAPAPVGLSHHEKRRIRKEARIASRNRFTSPVDIPSPIDDLLSSDSDDDSDWSTDSDASGVPAADPPAFDRRRQHLRARAIRRAKMLRASPKSRTYFVHLMQRVAGEDNRSFFGRKQSPVCRPASVLRFAARWRALYAALQMEDTLAGHPLAMAFPAQKPGFLEAKSRSSRHRWLVDSGANNHMVTDTTECSGAVTPTSGHINGVDVDVTGEGNCPIIVTTDSGGTIPVVVREVKVTPHLLSKTRGMFSRIFSVRQAVNHGCTVVFDPTGSFVRLPSGSKLPLLCDNGLFWLPCEFPGAPSLVAAPSSATDTKSVIHRRLCHLHDDGIRRLAAMKIPGMPQGGMFQHLQFCRCCSLAKSTAADICRQSTRDHDPPTCFYMMAIDLWGPVDKAAIGGYKYVLGNIDYLSGYHLAELLRTKDEAASAWRRMLLQIRTLGYSVMVVRVDNDSVLLSASFRDVCNEFNVDIQRTAPYRHHHLARIERHWRTVVDAVTALLTDAALAKSFWGYAFLTVSYVRNRVWHSGAGCIPFQKVTGQAPDLSGLRVFGCPAYVHVDPSRRKKLEPKAWEGIFVGYACDSPAYLIYNPATKNVIRSQNVKFNELWLPSHSLSAKNLGETGSDDDSLMEIQFAESRTPAPGEQVVNRHSHDNSDSHVSDSTNGTPGSGEKTPNSYPLGDLFTAEEDAEDGAEPQPGFTWVEPGADDPLGYEPPSSHRSLDSVSPDFPPQDWSIYDHDQVEAIGERLTAYGSAKYVVFKPVSVLFGFKNIRSTK